jgi:hypothetical protein
MKNNGFKIISNTSEMLYRKGVEDIPENLITNDMIYLSMDL